MARKAPRVDTLKVLYARSGNECAFSNCMHPVFNDNGLYIAQLCHIEAVEKGGPRYNELQTAEERNNISNLLFMCHRHHKETDDIKEYPVERLKKIKEVHENRFTEKGKVASEEMIRQILFETNYFWNKQNLKVFDFDDLKIKRDFDRTLIELFAELDDHIKTIEDYCDISAESDSDEKLKKDLQKLLSKANLDFNKIKEVDYYKSPFVSRNWEMHNLARPNYFSNLSLCVSQLKVKVLEELHKSYPDNLELKEKLDLYRTQFEELYDNSYYVD
jgi:hypothetical protein